MNADTKRTVIQCATTTGPLGGINFKKKRDREEDMAYQQYCFSNIFDTFTTEQVAIMKSIYKQNDGKPPSRRVMGELSKTYTLKPVKVRRWFEEETKRRNPATAAVCGGGDYADETQFGVEALSNSLASQRGQQSSSHCVLAGCCAQLDDFLNLFESMLDRVEQELNQAAILLPKILLDTGIDADYESQPLPIFKHDESIPLTAVEAPIFVNQNGRLSVSGSPSPSISLLADTKSFKYYINNYI